MSFEVEKALEVISSSRLPPSLEISKSLGVRKCEETIKVDSHKCYHCTIKEHKGTSCQGTRGKSIAKT